MRLNVVFRYMGIVLLILAAFMAVSAGVSWYNDMDSSFYPLLLSALLTSLLGIMPLIFVERQPRISNKEGFGIVVGSWLMACIVGTFPYLIWGGEFSLVNAWFESVSGFTTTGASILNDVESLPRGLMFWRIASTWIGGMGVVMFALVILPTYGASRMMYSGGEISQLAKDNYHYRTKVVVRILMVVYVGLTAIFTLLLHGVGMCWFDALCHAMSSTATSGFSTHSASVAHFDSLAVELIMMTSLAISGIHFGLIYATVMGKRNNIFRSEVTRFYLSMLVVGSVLIALSLWVGRFYPTFWTSLRHGAFQFVSIVTTSGFATTDTTVWAPFAVMVLIFGSFVCACSGSTTGGLKVNRILLAFKMLRVQLRQRLHPNAVIRIRMDGIVQSGETLHGVSFFIVAYLLIIFAGTLLQALLGQDLMTAFSGSLASMSNVGPGFGDVGSMGNYGGLSSVSKLIHTTLMLLGRLEIFGLLQFFMFRWWK